MDSFDLCLSPSTEDNEATNQDQNRCIDITTLPECNFDHLYSHDWIKNKNRQLHKLTESNNQDDEFIDNFINSDQTDPLFHSSVKHHLDKEAIKRLLDESEWFNDGLVNAMMEILNYKRSLHTYSQKV